jgi:hypothetical protein
MQTPIRKGLFPTSAQVSSSSENTPRDLSVPGSPADTSPTGRGKLVTRTNSNAEAVKRPFKHKRNLRQLEHRRRSFCEQKEAAKISSLPLIESLSEVQMELMAEKVKNAVEVRQRGQSSPFWDLVSGFLGSGTRPSSTSSSSSNPAAASSSSGDEVATTVEEMEKKDGKSYYHNVLLCDKCGAAVGLPVVLVFSSKRLKVLRAGSLDVMWSIPFSHLELFKLHAEVATLSLRFCPLGMSTYHTLYFYSAHVIEMYSSLVVLINAQIVARFESEKAKKVQKPLTPR